MIRFVIDSSSIDLENAENKENYIEYFLDLIDEARLLGHEVSYDESVFNNPLISERTFWELFDKESPVQLSPEIGQRLAALFGSMVRWDNIEAPWPETFDISINGSAPIECAPIAWTHQQAKSAGMAYPACLCANSGRARGKVEVTVDGVSLPIWLITNGMEMEKFFRWVIEVYSTKPDDFEELSGSAFQNLDFTEKCFDGITKMSKPFRHLAPIIVKHLSALSDDGSRIFTGNWQRAQAEFGGVGVEVTDENGRTKSNSTAAKERLVNVDGKEFYCWWHTKIEPDRDRIHFCPDLVPTRGPIIVGIFCEHLTV